MAKKYGTTMLSEAEKEKRTPKFLRNIFESPRKKAERLSTASGKANTAATKKMYAAESMFKSAKKAERAISAAKRDTAKTKTGPVTPMTARDRGKVRVAPKGSIKDPRKALDAETRKSYQKRIAYMEKRKAAGKNYSKKNLADLKAKLK
tara:strand:- start:432 stop:878 length:447 start_codon:yes stop_codon:yes gene_type:complete